MNYTQWVATVAKYEEAVDGARSAYNFAVDARDAFLRETVGVCPHDVATVEKTAEMVSRIYDMKRNDLTEVKS